LAVTKIIGDDMTNKTFDELIDDCQFVTKEMVGWTVHVKNIVSHDNFYIRGDEWAVLRDMTPDDNRFPAWLKELQEFACPPPAKPAKGQ
jgi:hypothetical protein